MVAAHKDKLLNECEGMLREEKREDLLRMYRLLKRIPVPNFRLSAYLLFSLKPKTTF